MITDSKPATHSRFEVLDGMRGIAAITIMIYHFSFYQTHVHLANASLAVDIFFMLSGFVITHSYGTRLQRGMTARDYIGKRLVRLYPMFIVGIIMGIPVLYYMQTIGFANGTFYDIVTSFLSNLFYLPSLNNFAIQQMGSPSFTTEEIFTTDPPAWSLFFEIVASLAFLIIYRLGRQALTWLVICSLAAYVVYGVVFEYINHRYDFGSNIGWNSKTLIGGIPRVFYGFSAGILIYSLAGDQRFEWVRTLVGRFVKTPLLVYILLFLVLVFQGQYRGLFPLLVLGLIAPFLVYVGSVVRCPSALSLATAQFLGWISYPLYCVHFPIGRLVFAIADRANISMNVAMLISVGLSLGVASVLTKFFDEPVRRYLSGLLQAGPSARLPVKLRP